MRRSTTALAPPASERARALTPAASRPPSRHRVRAHRQRLRARGLRPVELWLPDVRASAFRREAHRQSQLLGIRPAAAQGQGQVMRRGEIWLTVGGTAASSDRAVVIVQDDRFHATAQVTVCALLAGTVQAPLMRVAVAPNVGNRLHIPCQLRVDGLTTLPKTRLGACIGRLDAHDIARLNQAVAVFLGLAISPHQPDIRRRRGPVRRVRAPAKPRPSRLNAKIPDRLLKPGERRLPPA